MKHVTRTPYGPAPVNLPAHLQPFEALLPQEPGPARVDALLALSAQPHPLPEQVALAEQARNLASSLNDPARTARAELRLGALLDGPEALALVRAAARRFEELNDAPQELACVTREVELLRDPHGQLTALLRAADLAEQAAQPGTEQALRTGLGTLLRQLNDPEAARAAFTRALELADRQGARTGAAEVLLGLGELALDAHEPQAALEHLRAAGHLTHGEGTAAQARALGGLGRTYLLLGDAARSARFLDAALPLMARHGRPDEHAALLDARADTHATQGEPDAADALLRQSLDLSAQDWPARQGLTLLQLAALDRSRDRAPQAAQTLRWAVQFGLERQHPALVAAAHQALADLAEAQGDAAETAAQLRAWGYAREAHWAAQVADAQRTEQARRDAQEALACRAARRDTLHLLEGTVQDASTRLAAMQIMLERWRSSSMLDTESGAHSRPFGMEVLGLHYSRCVRLRAPLALAIVGIEVQAPPTDGPADLFTSNVLSAVARVLEGQVRAMDTVARFDRFKFMVIFPETATEGAAHPLERVIEQVRTYDWGVPGMQGAVSVGAGLVGRGFVQGVNLLIDAADAEYYRARRQGPNTLSITR